MAVLATTPGRNRCIPAPPPIVERLVIVNASLPYTFFSIWPPVAVNILYFLMHAIDGLGGGGYRRNTHYYLSKNYQPSPINLHQVGTVVESTYTSIGIVLQKHANKKDMNHTTRCIADAKRCRSRAKRSGKHRASHIMLSTTSTYLLSLHSNS